MRNNLKKINTLTIDIETSPNIGVFWGCGNQYVSHEQILVHRKIVAICYKWAGKKKVHKLHWSASQCDKKMLEKIIPVINKADLIIGQNHERFDLKWVNTRIAFHQLDPINVKVLTTEDTQNLMKGNFYLNSNSLLYASKYFDVQIKKDGGGWERIINILNGCKVSLEEHLDYCAGDVVSTEELFFRICPYVKLKRHIGALLYNDTDDTPPCGHPTHKRIKWGTYLASLYKYQRYKCTECGHVWKSNKRMK